MTSGQADKQDKSAGRRSCRIWGAAVVLAALGLAVLWMKVVHGGENPTRAVETIPAQRGPLTISVLEAGTVQAKDPVILSSGTPHLATIVSIVPEGTQVRQGDLLVELDVSAVIDHLVDQRIILQNTEAAWINARENLVIVKSLAQSEMELARLRYQFALQDLAKYEQGQYPNLLAAAEGKIRLNEEELVKARDYLNWSERLHGEKYLSDTQLKADELAVSRAQLNLDVAQNDLNLLEKYTYHRQMAELTSEVNQAKMALERAEAKAHANVIQAEATLTAREQMYQKQVEHVARHESEIAASKIYAPTEGIAIYATSVSSSGGHSHDDRQPLADGVMVWNRQELIYLQRSAAMVVRVPLHEGNLQKVQVGMPVLVTFDALPGKKLMGTVTRVAPLPDSQSMWGNPDLKVYRTEIAFDANDPALRCGMNCRTEIIVAQYPDALYVPIQTVREVAGQPTVYVLTNRGGVEQRKVELGQDNNRVVQVAGGLREGERVLLTPPGKVEVSQSDVRLAGMRDVNANELAGWIKEKLKAAGNPVSEPAEQKKPAQTKVVAQDDAPEPAPGAISATDNASP